jgi:hypothetical protein
MFRSARVSGEAHPPHTVFGPRRHAGCQSQEGMSRREASAIVVRSSSEGKKPRERAGLKHIREIRAGARRRSRLERQGRNKTRTGKVRGWWLARIGLRWGGTKPRESRSSGLGRLRGIRVKLWSGAEARGRITAW